MPKRVIHGEGIWRSDKLARVEPSWVRAEYANLIPLALANGVFESNPRRIWSEVYSYNRNDISVQDVETVILPALVGVGLLFCWKDEDGKGWGYWPGIEKPGRLPGQSRRGRNEAVGPEPPAEELRKFLESNGIHKLPGFGFGLGLGSGSGLGKGSGITSSEAGASNKAKKTITQSGQETNLEAVKPLATLLAQRILENNHKSELSKETLRERRIEVWTIDLEKMVRLDGWTNDEIRQVIEFTQNDSFWRSNILSAAKLREKRDQLRLKMQEQQGREQGGTRGAPNPRGSNSGASKRPGPFIPAALRKPIPAAPNALRRTRED